MQHKMAPVIRMMRLLQFGIGVWSIMDFERFGHWIRHLIGSQPFRVSGCLRISVGLAVRGRECDRAIILVYVYMYVRMYVHTYAGR